MARTIRTILASESDYWIRYDDVLPKARLACQRGRRPVSTTRFDIQK